LIDYPVLKTNGKRFYKLFVDDGNALGFYQKSPSDGKVIVTGTQDKKVEIILKDAFNNTTRLMFRLRPSLPVTVLKVSESVSVDPSVGIMQNTLAVKCKPCKDPLTVYTSGVQESVEPTYKGPQSNTYLIDLRQILPDSLSICGSINRPNLKSVIPSGVDYSYFSDWVDLSFPSNALFDTLYLNLERDTARGTFTIGRADVPVNKAIAVNVSTSKHDGDLYRKSGRSSYSFVGGKREGDRIKFYTRELGEFAILKDDTAPTIRPLSVNGYRARFKIKDELSGIASYEATIDGQWLLMHYDAKSGTIWSQALDSLKQLAGEFVLKVVDNAGNEATYRIQI